MKILRFVVSGLLALALGVLVVTAQSNPPAPTATVLDANKQQVGNSESQKPKDNQGPANQNASSQQKVTAPSTEQKSQQQADQCFAESFFCWIVEWDSNRTIALFTIVLAVVAFLQWRIYKETLESNRRESRAYVSITAHSMRVMNGNIPVVSLRLINFGQTPAKRVSARLDVVIRQEKIGTEFQLPPIRNGWAPEGVAFPNAEQNDLIKVFVNQSATNTLTAEEIGDVIDGKKFMYVLGEVRYEDVFGGNQFSTCCCGVEALPATFKLWFGGDVNASFGLALKSAPMGNTAT